MDPLDEALEHKAKEAVAKKDHELHLWQQWKQNDHSSEHLEPLLDLYQPLIRRKVIEYGGGLPLVSEPALEAEVTKRVIGQFRTFDPNRGASLNTHVQYGVQKARRFVGKNQNFAYIPPKQSGRIGDMMRAQTALREELGRDATRPELAGHLGMSVKQLTRLQKSLVKDIPASTGLEADPLGASTVRDREVLSLLPAVLSPAEKSVFDLVYHPTNPVTSTGELAKLLGKNQSQVSRLKTSILEKVQQYR